MPLTAIEPIWFETPPQVPGCEKYMRPFPPSAIATGAQPADITKGVTVPELMSIRASWSAPVTATHTVPSGPAATDVGPAPTLTRPVTSPAGVMRATVPENSSATQKFPSGAERDPVRPGGKLLKSWMTAASAEAGKASAVRARARRVRRRISRPYRLHAGHATVRAVSDPLIDAGGGRRRARATASCSSTTLPGLLLVQMGDDSSSRRSRWS